MSPICEGVVASFVLRRCRNTYLEPLHIAWVLRRSILEFSLPRRELRM